MLAWTPLDDGSPVEIDALNGPSEGHIRGAYAFITSVPPTTLDGGNATSFVTISAASYDYCQRVVSTRSV